MPSRREFLIRAPLALLGAALTPHIRALSPSTTTLSPFLRRVGELSWRRPANFAELHFLTSDPSYSDYRPAIDAMAQHVVFERTPAAGGNTSLYILATAGAIAQPFIQKGQRNDFDTGPSQTRPDWSWITGNVVLNVASSNSAQVKILIAAADGTPLQNVRNSSGYLYPTWSPDSRQLIVYNNAIAAQPNATAAQPQPRTSLIGLDGTVVILNLDGNNADRVFMFGGFATPTPGNVNLIAYAGQPDMAWGPAASAGYNQDYNYVFVNAENNGVFTSAPLEPQASIAVYDPAYQGRAPVWSPDGNYVAFESDRAGGYALFLANVAAGTAPVQVTDAHYGAQHPKFFPDGTKLITTVLQTPGGTGPRGIAWVDISQYL